MKALHGQTQDAEAVKHATTALLEHEYDDDLYTGVPESRIEQRVGEGVASSGIEWLERIGEIRRAADGSVVFCD